MSGCERQVCQEATTRHGIWTVQTHSRHIFIPFFDTLFLCMYTVIMVYQRLFTPLNWILILDIRCWYPMYSLRLAPQWFTFTSSDLLYQEWFVPEWDDHYSNQCSLPRLHLLQLLLPDCVCFSWCSSSASTSWLSRTRSTKYNKYEGRASLL